MSDEKSNDTQSEKAQANVPQDKQPETKQINLSESAIKNAGDQGISLTPVGGHATNPFTPQDIVQTQPPAQIVAATPASETVTPPPTTAQSSGSASDAGE